MIGIWRAMTAIFWHQCLPHFHKMKNSSARKTLRVCETNHLWNKCTRNGDEGEDDHDDNDEEEDEELKDGGEKKRNVKKKMNNKAGYTAAQVACGWAGEKVNQAFGYKR